MIYAAIINLSCEIHFKHENILILNILPESNKPSLHKINHYLSSIVDNLDSLWCEIAVYLTAKCSEGKIIQVALILVSCDISAIRKVCGHISAFVSYYCCKKKANYVNN